MTKRFLRTVTVSLQLLACKNIRTVSPLISLLQCRYSLIIITTEIDVLNSAGVYIIRNTIVIVVEREMAAGKNKGPGNKIRKK